MSDNKLGNVARHDALAKAKEQNDKQLLSLIMGLQLGAMGGSVVEQLSSKVPIDALQSDTLALQQGTTDGYVHYYEYKRVVLDLDDIVTTPAPTTMSTQDIREYQQALNSYAKALLDHNTKQGLTSTLTPQLQQGIERLDGNPINHALDEDDEWEEFDDNIDEYTDSMMWQAIRKEWLASDHKGKATVQYYKNLWKTKPSLRSDIQRHLSKSIDTGAAGGTIFL